MVIIYIFTQERVELFLLTFFGARCRIAETATTSQRTSPNLKPADNQLLYLPLNATLPSSPVLPVSGDETHEQDACVHVQIEGGGAKVAVEAADGDGAAGVVGDSER